jgi:hypothetical protein
MPELTMCLTTRNVLKLSMGLHQGHFCDRYMCMVMMIGIHIGKVVHVHPLRFGCVCHYRAIQVSYFGIVSFRIDTSSDFSNLAHGEECEGMSYHY